MAFHRRTGTETTFFKLCLNNPVMQLPTYGFCTVTLGGYHITKTASKTINWVVLMQSDSIINCNNIGNIFKVIRILTSHSVHIVHKDGPQDWRKCKYLDTEEDITRRKCLAIATYNQLKHFLQSKRGTIHTKMRIFNAYVASIFLYNCELWALTTKLEHKIDVFQRTLLRRTIAITKLDKIYQCRPIYEHKLRTMEQNNQKKKTKLGRTPLPTPRRHTSQTSPSRIQHKNETPSWETETNVGGANL